MTERTAYTPQEVADSIRVSRETVYRWITAGVIASVKLRSKRRISAGELARISGAAGVSAGVGTSVQPERSGKSAA